MSGNKLLQAAVRWPLALMLAITAMILFTSQAQAQHTSAECPAQAATVSSGGAVTINITDCAFKIGFAGIGDIDGGSFGTTDLEDHGTATTRITGGQWFLDYSHNGSTGVGSTDVFEFSDASFAGLGDVRVTITINASASPLTVTPGTLPTLTAGTAFSQTLTTVGGTAPYSYALQSGVLPQGVSLSSGGALTGTPTQRGAYSFSARATDSTTPTANFVDKGYTGSVRNPSISITPTTATAGQGAPFSQALTGVGGVAPYSYLLETGSFPAGISISAAGVISGTTSAAIGNYNVNLRVTDASTGPGSYFEVETFTLTVAALPTVSIAVAPAPASVSEDGATNLVYTVTRSATSTSALTVNLTTGGTATSGTDYTGGVTSVTIAANVTTATVTIDPTVDAAVEANETVIFTVATGSGYTVGAPASETGTILNDDVPSATIAVAPASVSEDGAANLVYTVTLNTAPTVATSINFAASGTATSGTDYAAVSSPLVIAAGVTTGTVTINPTADATIEADETVILTLSAGTGYTIGAPNAATGTIANDDLPTLTINDLTLAEGNAGTTNASFTVSLSAPAGPGGVSFDIATNNGTAAAGSDYVANNLTAQTIPAGATTYTFTVVVNGDALNESSETFFVNVTNVSNAVVGDGQGLGTITNDDVPTASITVAPASTLENGTANLVYTVALNAAAAAPITVNFTLGGTATNGNDYNSTGSTVVIPAGATSQTIVIDPNPNGTIEPDETVIIALAAGAGYVVGTPASATGTILNDDFPSITIGNATVTEGNSGTTNAVFTLALSAPAATGGVTLDIATFNRFALAGQDFVANSQTGFFIPAGATSATFTVVVNGDVLNEPDEDFFVRITNVTGAFVNGAQAIGLITNDDPLPSVSINGFSLVEGNSGASVRNFAITLNAPSGQPVSIDVATANGSATAGTDYNATTASFAFQPGETTKNFPVTILGDTAPESDESFSAVLSGAFNVTIATGTATATIVNDDVLLDIQPQNLPNGSVGTFYSDTLTTDGGTAPYSYAVTAGTVPAGLTFNPSGILSGMPLAAGNASFTITATDSSGAPGPYSASRTYTVTIAAPVITLTPVTLPDATFGVPYNQAITADGSVGPYVVTIIAGSLPAGITLSPDGTLSGTPTVGGPIFFGVRATDATPTGYSGVAAYTLTVNVPALVLPSTTLPDGATDVAYSAQINSATGGIAPYRYAVTSGELPYGLTMSSTGAITGTPTTGRLFSFVVTASDSNPGGARVVQQSYSINIVNTPPVVNPVTVNVAYGAGLTPVPLNITGTANSVTVVTPPTNGRAVVDRMTISYIPDTGFAGSDSFTYIASNNGANSAPALVTISVANPAITITAGGPLTATVGSAFNETFTFNGGTQPFTNYQVTGLPAGMQAGSSGANTIAIIGTPTNAGSFTLTVSATDASTGAGPFGASQTFNLVVAGPTLTLTPGAGTLAAPYNASFSQTFTASGGIGPYTYTLTGALPAGLNFAGDTLTGVPTAPGSYPITVSATDTGSTGAGSPFTIVQSYTINVPPPTITIAPASLSGGTVGLAYTQPVSATGGVASYGYGLTAGALPPGLMLSAGGLLTGTPTAGGTFNFTLTATDSFGQSGSQGYGLTIAGAIVALPPTTLSAGQVGATYNATLNPATGGTGPYGYAVTGGALPGGMTLSAGGVLSGTPTAFGTFNFSVTATDSSTGVGPYSVTQSYSVQIVQQAPLANSVSAAVGYGSTANPIMLDITGGVAASVAIATGPTNGTALASGISITYTPTPGFAGTDSFTYTATNAGGTSSPATVTITVGGPTITISAGGRPTATVGAAYSETFTFTGGTQPFSGYQVTNLPAGVAISGGGANSVTVSGTPTQSGSFVLNVSGTDASTGTGPFTPSQVFTLAVAAPSLTLTPGAGPLTANYGASFSQIFTASGGVGPLTYTLTGALPAGLNFVGNMLSGTATAPGSYPVTVTATDTGSTGVGSPFSVAQNYTINVPAPLVDVSPASIPAASAGVAYSQALTGSGGVGPYTLVRTAGTLPRGLSFSGNSISGTPTEVGSFNLTITATDAFGQSGPRSYSLTVSAPTLMLTPASGTTNVAFNQAISQTYTASGGIGPYAYAVMAGGLPAGIALDASSGQLSGNTTQVGTFNFTVTATDTGVTGLGAPFTASGNYAITVAPPTIRIDQSSLPDANVASAYNTTLTASGAIAPYSFAVTAGALPAGLNLSSTGTLSGTPTAGGIFNFTITASDGSGAPGPFSAAQAYSLTVAVPTIGLPPTSLANGNVAQVYSASLQPASGGTAPYRYAVTSGALPVGLTLSAGGTISGTPSAFGTFSFAVTATDSSTGTGPYAATQNYAIAVVDQPPIAGPVSVNRAYGSGIAPVPLNLSGGAASSVAIGIAPANGSATVSGLTISYQPNASFSGTDSFTYTATNAGGTSSPATVTVTVGAPILTITAGNPLSATVGQAYSQTFSFAGGTGPFGSYALTGLPAGVSLTGSTGNTVTISGSPNAQGTFALIVSGADASTGSGPFNVSQTFSLVVAGPNLVLAPIGGNFTAPYASPYSQTFAASGGVGPYGYVLTGNLPAGLTFNTATGIVSGTPTTSGNFAFTVTATDTGATGNGAPFTVAGNYTVTVAAPAIIVTPTALPAAIAGQNYAASLTASGAVGPYSYALTGGALPAGITLAANGQLSGVSSVSGAFAFTVQVRDANGQTGAANLTLNVGVPTLTLTPATLPTAVQNIAYSQALTAGGGIAPYSFAVTTGALPAGLTLNTGTGVISGAPTASGTANFAVTVSDSTGGTPATLTVNFALQVTARPDPALDPEVRGLVQAQVAATRRFAEAQVDNFTQRMESMHGESSNEGNGDGPGFSFRNNIRFSTPDYCRDAITMTTSAVCANRSQLTGIVPLNNWRADGSTSTDSANANASANAGSGNGGAGAPVTVWAGGAIRFGERDATSGRVVQDFESEGITIGADYRFSPSFAAGVGIGLGRDTVDVGDEGSRSSGEAKTIALYASHQFGKGFFIDWLAGYQKLDFDLRRYVTLNGALVNSRRTGDQWFGTVTAGADIQRGDWQLTPYARLDITRARLNGYSESSGSVFDLAFLNQDVDFTSIGAGARFKYRHKTTWGELLPQLRAEYQWNVERSADARVTYTDQISGPFSNISLSGIGREELTLGGKLEMLFVPDWALAFEYIARISPGAGTDNMMQVAVKHEF